MRRCSRWLLNQSFQLIIRSLGIQYLALDSESTFTVKILQRLVTMDREDTVLRPPKIGKHWACNLTPEMTTEKLQSLASSSLDGSEKEAILVLWNSSQAERKVKKFSIGPFNDAVFLQYLHKYVFWTQANREEGN